MPRRNKGKPKLVSFYCTSKRCRERFLVSTFKSARITCPYCGRVAKAKYKEVYAS